MIPSTVHVAIIGCSCPDVVGYCINRNSQLCLKYDIPFTIHKPSRNYKYKSPGIQIEHFKPEVLSNFKNSLFIDWDVELIDFPDLPENDYPYCGRWQPLNKPDSFIMYTTYGKSCDYLSATKKRIDEIGGGVVGSMFIALNKDAAIIPEYTAQSYFHHHTRCGGLDIPETWHELSIKEKEKWRNQ